MIRDCSACPRDKYGNHLWWFNCPSSAPCAYFNFDLWIVCISDSIRKHNPWFANAN